MNNKTLLIIQREYLTRVKKKSFVIMTILGPLLFAGLIIGTLFVSTMEDDEFKRIAVIDESRLFDRAIPNTKYLDFDFLSDNYFNTETLRYDVETAKRDLEKSDYFALLYIPKSAVETNKGKVEIYSHSQPNMGLKMHITNSIEKELENIKLYKKAEEIGITEKDIIDLLKLKNTSIDMVTITMDNKGTEKQSSTELAMIIGYICGFVIYMFIFMYGSQIMRGVIEEKSSRIIEVIVSSVKPFQLMLGKIVGVALVGLTQFLLWIVLTFGIVTIGQTLIIGDVDVSKITQTTSIGSQLDNHTKDVSDMTVKMEKIMNSISSINFTLIIGMFIFYFLGGYLLYSALFAAIGSAVDNEADTQQFMMPITIPLILGIVVMMSAINNPSGSLAYWFSIIPFTSPVVMLARLPFGVPVADIIISAVLLVVTFIFITWFAAKIYRVGILMYGKKVNYKELWKWFRYS